MSASIDENKIKRAVKDILIGINENPNREGLRETPKRVTTAWQKLTEGYSRNLKDEIKVFENSSSYNDIIISGRIEFFSTCEHHLLPFFGHVYIGYVPGDTIIGLSKLSRAVDIYARRLQDQERITVQIADEIMGLLKPKGVAVYIEAKHFCNMVRGVEKKDSNMITMIFRGVLERDDFQKKFLSVVNSFNRSDA